MNDTLKVTVTHGGKNYDVSGLYKSVTWSGSIRQMAREASVELLAPGESRDVPAVPTALGDVLRVALDGKALFWGYIVRRKRSSGGVTMTLDCLDRGWYLARNEGWYSFNCTPEAAVRTICADYGIPVGSLASTGVTIPRKFPGVALHRIINTMYSKASEITGKRYQARFDGAGRLCTVQKPETGSLTLAPRANLSSAVYTEDVSSICTSVAIYGEDGGLIRTVDDSETRAAYGLFRHIITQRDDTDAGKEARAYLDDCGEQQTVSVTCLGDPGLISGGAVVMQAQNSGAKGLFWIDSDRHAWQNGKYLCVLGLNFRNLMDTDNAGKEE